MQHITTNVNRKRGRCAGTSGVTSQQPPRRLRDLCFAAIIIAWQLHGQSTVAAQTADGMSSADRIVRLIANLSDDRFQVRDAAMWELVESGIEAEPLLRKVLGQPGDRETRERARVALRLIQAKRNPTVIDQLFGHGANVNMVVFSPDGETLASAGEDGIAILWKWRKDKTRRTIQAHAGGLLFANFSPDGKSLVTTGRDSKIKIWDAESGELRTTLSDHNAAVSAAVFSPDGRLLVTAGDDATVKVRDASGEVRYSLVGHKRPAIALAISPDGKTLISAGGNWSNPFNLGEVHAWDLNTRERIWSAEGGFGGIWGLAFSSDGQRIAGACLDHSIRLWDVKSGREQVRLKGHTDRVIWVAFRPRSSQLVSSSYDGTVRLWDTQQDVATAVLPAHAGPVQRLGFAPDGQVFATCGNDRTIRIWRFPN